MLKMELQVLEDQYLIAIAFCGLFFTTIVTIYMFSIPKFRSDEELGEEELNVVNDQQGQNGDGAIDRDIKRKEKIRLERIQAKVNIQKYKKSCQKSQILHRRSELASTTGTSLICLDNVLDMLSEQTKIFVIADVAKSLKMNPKNLKSILSDLVDRNVMCGIVYTNSHGDELFVQFSEEELNYLAKSVSPSSMISNIANSNDGGDDANSLQQVDSSSLLAPMSVTEFQAKVGHMLGREL